MNMGRSVAKREAKSNEDDTSYTDEDYVGKDSGTSYDDGDYSYDEDKSSGNSNKHDLHYNIDVNCANGSIESSTPVTNLFDYDFPLDKIMSLNLSSNNLRQLRLNDGYEDMVAIETFDFSSNPDLKTIPFKFIQNFIHLRKL